MTLRISVIVPAYNRAGFLPATLDSILAQTLAPAEVVVVDDGSTDNTAEVLRRYEPRVRTVTIENSGVCRARNIGVQYSTGNWIAFCDSDDLWLPGKLALQAELARRVPETRFIFSQFCGVVNDVWTPRDQLSCVPGYLDSIAAEQVGPDLLLVKETLYPKVIESLAIVPSTIFMTREFFDQVGGFDETFTRAVVEDPEFVLRCVQETPVGVVMRPVVGMRRHEGNTSGDRLRDLIGTVKILEFARARHRLAPRYEPLIHETLLRVRLEAADRAFAAGDYASVRELVQPLSNVERPWKTKLKSFVSAMPEPVRTLLAKAAIGFPAKLQ